MKVFAAVLALLTILTPTALAKGDTVEITIEGPGLAVPIEIPDPAVRKFNIWSGPGTSTFDGRQGLIIDWSNRADAALMGLQHYKVSFYEETRSEPWLAYVVTYADDPSAEGDGFVYLPGGHDEFARLNMGHIYRGKGYEGHWFRATKEWDDFVRPFIAAVTAAH